MFYLVVLALLVVCAGAPAESEPFATSTSVSVSTVTRKESSTSAGRTQRGTNEPVVGFTERTSTVPLGSQAFERATLINPNLAKLQRNRKKILISNLKHSNDRIVLPDEGVGVVQTSTVSDQMSEDVSVNYEIKKTLLEDVKHVENGAVYKENALEQFTLATNQSVTDDEGKRKKDSTVEGRSLENTSAQENVNMNLRKKTRILPGATEAYVSVPKTQKHVNNNYFNRKEQDSGIHWTSSSEKLTPVQPDNSQKNFIRSQSSGQTDWIPFVPDRMPTRHMPSTSQQLRPIGLERVNKTVDKQMIIFPTDSRLQKESNVIPVRNVELTRTTERHRGSLEKSTESEVKLDTSRLPIKFRGPVKYKTNLTNETLMEVTKHQNKIYTGRNVSTGDADMKVSVTGTPWSVATQRVTSLTSPKILEALAEATESVVSTEVSRNESHTEKSPNGGVGDGLIVPPESVKIENIAKEPQETLGNTTPDVGPGPSSQLPSQGNPTTTPKFVDVWTSMKTIKNGEFVNNETDLVVPGSVDISQSSYSTTLLEVLKASTPAMETMMFDSTTETAGTTETPLVTVTLPKMLKTAVENSTITSVASQSTVDGSVGDDFNQLSVALGRVLGSTLPSTEEDSPTTSKRPVTEVATLPTPLKSGSYEEMEEDGIELSTDSEPMSTTVPFSKYPMHRPHRPQTTFTVTSDTDVYRRIMMNKTTTPVTDDTVKLSTRMETTPDRNVGSSLPVVLGRQNATTRLQSNWGTTTGTSRSSENPTTRTTKWRPASDRKSSRPVTETLLTTDEPTEGITSRYFVTPSLQTTTETSGTTTKETTTLLTSASFTTPSLTTEAQEIDMTIGTTLPPPSPATTTAFTVSHTTPTIDFKHVVKPETTQESIYYKNYIPTTINPRDDITEENVPAYLRLTVQTTSWMELCNQKEPLREAIIKMLSGHNVTSDAVHFLNLSDRSCQEKIAESQGIEPNGTIFLPVNMFLMDKNGDFDKNLSEAFLTIWGRQGLDFDLPIRKVDFVTPIVNLTELAEPPIGGSVVAAIVISCVAGICVILLGILFVIMKRRQKRFNYGQRCTPVSLDAYSLDSVSIYNSVRRKGHRASKRSYGNAAFDDPEAPSHPVNFAGLANFSSNKEQLHEEFSIVPQVYPKAEELPEGSETKNRYSNVIPLPETRVHLTVRDGDPLSDYINANYVRGNKGAEKLYIACQAPMESTIEDFWRMIWEQQCKVILMVTDLQENGIEKCADYLPANEVTDNLRLFGDYQVTLKKRDVKEKYIISNLTLKNMETNLWREVTHLWYLGWPDQGVPSEANSLIAFLIEARSQMKIQNGATSASPAVVHCSPGTGRTGTVIACDLCIREYEQSRMVDIPKCVFNLRRDRAGSVQTKDQYAFIYQVLNVYATKLTGGGIESI
ncbi:hypothetical protein RUM44_006044 [Polyplax serrata]|uniref:protein-tyrosine-phosphatase n=1 Tax=Polyplax serrata TaxID=468196 RepID=A0ABR1B0E6_POLSC